MQRRKLALSTLAVIAVTSVVFYTRLLFSSSPALVAHAPTLDRIVAYTSPVPFASATENAQRMAASIDSQSARSSSSVSPTPSGSATRPRKSGKMSVPSFKAPAHPRRMVPPFDFHFFGYTREEVIREFEAHAVECRDVDVNVHFLTYANKRPPDSKFCRSLISAAQNGISLRILNWGGVHAGMSSKFDAALRQTSSFPPCDFVVFGDAYDVLYARNPEEVKAVLLQRDPNGTRGLTVSVECNCWPLLRRAQDGKHLCDDLYPQSPSPYRYLNSGVWAGRAHAAVSVLEFLKSAMMFAGYSEEEFRRADDQELMALLYITLYSTAKPLIPSPFKVLDLDYNSEIVQSFQTTTEHHCNPEKDVEFAKDRRPVNTRTGTAPLMLHFNGGGKDTLLSVEHGMWYRHPEEFPHVLSEETMTSHRFPIGFGDESVSFYHTGCLEANRTRLLGKWKRHW